MPIFSDNTDFLADWKGEPLILPFKGKQFTFSAFPTLAEGMELQAIKTRLAEATTAAEVIVEDENGLYRRLIGDQWPALVAAGADEGDMRLFGITLFNTYLYGVEVGKRTWTGELFKAAEAQGEAEPTGTTTPTPPKAPKRSAGGKRTPASSR